MEKTGQALIAHQTNMRTISTTVDNVRAELGRLSTSSASNTGNAGSVDEVRNEIGALTDMHRYMDQISLASKISLEAMFYQLTKELEGRCHPENIEFGLDEDRLFILRQRVLERLSVEDSVQCEFLRLKASQQMFS